MIMMIDTTFLRDFLSFVVKIGLRLAACEFPVSKN